MMTVAEGFREASGGKENFNWSLSRGIVYLEIKKGEQL